MKKLVIWIAVLAVLGGGGWWVWKNHPDKIAFLKPAEPQAKKSGRPTTALVAARDISFAVYAAGDIGPADQVSVRPEVSGKIATLAVDIGDKVRRGDLLFALDDSDLQIERSQRQTEIEAAKLQIEGARLTVEKLQLNYNRTEQIFENKAPLQRSQRQTEIDAAKLQIESARLTLEKSQINFDRTKRLFEDKLLSKEVFENAQAELDQARNNHALASNNHQKLLTHEVLENAKAELDLAKNNHALARNSHERALKTLQLVEDKISKTKILAPFDCTVLTRPVSVGQAVSGSSGVNSGTEVLTIANLADMIITAHINQADVSRLMVGQKVNVEVEAVAGLKLTGSVDRIAPQATIRNSIKGYTTRILLRNADTAVRPGMTANITIPLASAESVLAVPLAAVFSEKGDRFVFVKKDEKYTRQPVLIGVSDYDFCEIRNGLEGGETVSLIQPADDVGIVSAAFQGPGKGGGKGGKGGGKTGGKGGYKGGGEGGGAPGASGGGSGGGAGGKGGRPGGGKGSAGGGKGDEGGSKSNSTGP